ncbi:MAG TPA: hypothetical protein VL485_18780, partial [Ktedonobacteraceae bacterium]|nr:hypothetical protein [Ktedonobacteraceae bacterium]
PWPAAAPEQQYVSAPWPAAAPEQQYVSAPWPAAAPEQQYVSAPWPATSTGSRPVPAYARPSTKHASAPVELRKPLKMPKEPKAPKAPKQPGQKRKGPPILITAVCLVLVAAVVLISQKDWLFNQASQLTTGTQSITQTSSSSTPLAPGINTITNNKEISPFLFGTNMALFHDNDEPILNSAATRQQLKNIGVRIIRMPTRPTLKTQTEITAAEDIKAIGASALVVMAGPEYKSGPLLDTDQKIVSDITGVFGKQPVYFEFGNESDLNGINVNQYITKWNQVIPTLKKQFPTARFIALDNYQFDRLYLKTFLQQANPLPDGVSWHEYTCSVYWSAQFCLMNIDSWPIHFQQAREAMKEAIGKELPIWISEWNYTSDQVITNGKPIDDGKYNNPTFMNEWTTRAMQTLIQNRIFASMQYFATNQPMPLVYNNQIGIEGKIFQQNYKTVMVDDKTPPAQYYKVPPPVVDPNAQYSFEGPGTDGWSLVGGPPATISTTKALNGTHSLQFTLADNSENDFPFVSVGGSQMPSTPKAGQIISGYLYVANPKALINAKIFVADPSHAWHFTNSITLTPGAWNKVWYSLPLNYTSPVSQVGIQFFTSTPGVSTDVYLDQFAWK